MAELKYHTLDLNFQGFPKNIASFAVPLKSEKWVLIESGPYSCYRTLVAELDKHGIALSDIEKVFVTHIHLDHSGGAWALAEAGAQVYVHPVGAPHLIDPTKLYESAQRIYGEKMESLWSKVSPIPKEKVIAANDGETLLLPGEQGELRVTAHHTPGHASHHIAWQINDVLFCGDVCGVRINKKMLDIPAPPPEFHIGQWLDSLAKIRSLATGSIVSKPKIREIAFTHFGPYRDIDSLLHQAENRLHEIVAWFRGQVKDKPVDEWKVTPENFTAFIKKRYHAQAMTEKEISAMININPPAMTVSGILRYLKKNEQFN